MRWFFGILFLVGGFIGACFAIDSVLWQQRAVQKFVPTDAIVLSSQVKIHRGRSTSYSPAITYSYTFGGQFYQSTRVLPFSEQGSSTWARSIVDHFPFDAKVTAFVDPADPAESVLLQVYTSTPYFLSALALAAAAAGMGLLTGILGPGRTTMQAVPLGSAGWSLLLPGKTIRRHRRDAALLLLLSGLPTAALLAHYLLVVRPVSTGGWVLIILLPVPIIIELMFLVRAYILARHISDARLQVNPAPMDLGHIIQLRAEIDAYHPLRVTSFLATIVCIEHYKEKSGNKTVYGARDHVEKTIDLAANISVPAGQLLSGEGQVQFDRNSPHGRDSRAVKSYPYFTWEVRIRLVLAGSPDYRVIFPLTAA